MKKANWIIGLSLAGVLAASGAVYAMGNAFTPQQQGGAVHALYTPNVSVSSNQQFHNTSPNTSLNSNTDSNPGSSLPQNPNNQNPNTFGPSNGYGGYGMMGGYYGYGRGNGGNGSYGGYGMMGGNTGNSWGCGGYGAYGGTGNSLATKDQSSLQADTSASLQNAKVDKTNNTITYTGDTVKLVVLGGPEQADGKFVIDGLVNPTLQIPKGATVTVEFANADEGMPHAFEVTNAAPPYDFMAMMDGGIYPGSLIGVLPEAQNNQYASAQTTFKADYAGTFYYICQYPGHASKGMYGKLVIE